MQITGTASPLSLTLISVVISLIFIICLDADELNVLGNVLIGIGGIMVIAAVQGDYLQSAK